MLKKFFNFQTKSINSAAGLLGIAYFFSGILSLVSDRLLARAFGVSLELREQLDIYYAAFRIPDFIYGILIAGGIISVFLPIFSDYYNRSKKEGWELTNITLNCFLFLLIIICAIALIFTPLIIGAIAPGFSAKNKDLTVSLTRIMLLSPIFFVLSSIFSGILNYFSKFLIYALAPILYNLGIISGILFFYPLFGLKGLAIGVIVGAFLHLAIQIPSAIGSGFKYRPIFKFSHPGLKKIFFLTLPRVIGSIASHLNLIVVTAIASTLIGGSISIFNLSNNLSNFPILIVGVSFSSAVFPALAKAWTNFKKEEFLETFALVFRQILFLAIPLGVLIFLLRTRIVWVVLGIENFEWWSQMIAACLGIFSLGVFALCLVPFLTRTFFSIKNTKTPVLIAITAIVLNIILSFLFIWLLKFENPFRSFLISLLEIRGIQNIAVIALPLAVAMSGIFQLSLLLFFLKKKIGHLKLKGVLDSFKKIAFASLVMGILVNFSLNAFEKFLTPRNFTQILIQTVVSAIIGVLIYISATFFLKSPELKTFL